MAEHQLITCSCLIANIEAQRCTALDRLLSALEDLYEGFMHDKAGCSFECNSMQLGALTKQLCSKGLLLPRPKNPFAGYSFDHVASYVRGLREPRWSYNHRCSYDYAESDPCSLESHTGPIVSSIEDNLRGLDLSDFVAAKKAEQDGLRRSIISSTTESLRSVED